MSDDPEPSAEKDVDGNDNSGHLASRSEPVAAPSWWVLILVGAGWFGLWCLTPGLIANGVGHLFTDDPATSVLLETVAVLPVVIVLIVMHGRYNRILFARSRLLYLYGAPLLLAGILPLHYGLLFPVALYILWMTVSVFWQDYLTFGLLQSYLGERLPTRAVIPVVAVMFYLGHAILIPDRFAPINVLPSLAILALGLLMAYLRARLETIHLVLAVHLAFYFIFA